MNFFNIFLGVLFFSSVTLSAHADDVKNVSNEQVLVNEMEPLVVEGDAYQRKLKDEIVLTPGAVTLIDSEEAFQRDMSNLADLLHFTPGIWAASDTGNDNIMLSSRGSNLDATDYDMNGIKLFQDGLSTTTADGNNHNRVLDPLNMRYASIARGANALTYGASNLGGAIDFITPTARNSLFDKQLYLNAGSHGQQQIRLSAAEVWHEKFDALVTVEAKNWDGYREHNEQSRSSVYANLGWQINQSVENRWFLTQIHDDQELASGLSASQVKQDPEQAGTGAVTGNFQVNVDTTRIANKTAWTFDENTSLEFGFAVDQQTLYHPIVDKVMVDFDGPGPLEAVEVFSLLIDTDHQDIASMLRYNKTIDRHNLMMGFNFGVNSVEGGHYRNDAGKKNGLTTKVDNSANSLEAFVVDRFLVDDMWTLIYGTQLVSAKRSVKNTDVASATIRNPEETYRSVNPRLGVIYNLNEQSSLFANVSKLYEAPTNFELQDDIKANDETLDAMHGTVLEVGTRGMATVTTALSWNWEVAVYTAKISDEILSVDDPAAPGTSLSTNIDETKHAGVEALLSANYLFGETQAHSIEPLLSITLNKFTFVNDTIYGNNDLPAAPDKVINGQIIYQHSKGFYAGPTFDVVGERYADFSNTYKIDNYTLLGLRAGYVNEKDKWKVFAEAKNINDKDYIATHSVVDKADPTAEILRPGLPTSFYVGMILEF